MSVCKIGVRYKGEEWMVLAHYLTGIMNWSKFHGDLAENARRNEAKADLTFWKDYWAREARQEEFQAKEFYHTAAGGVERDSAHAGCWRCEKAEQQQWKAESLRVRGRFDFNSKECALVLDFDAKHATILDRQFCNWERYLPEDWTCNLNPEEES